jgi:thiamine-monophosphate kinase
LPKRTHKGDLPERQLIGWIRGRIKCDRRVAPIGPGDDAALVAVRSSSLLVSIDTIAEGVDFTLQNAAPSRIGRKALAVNLSDIAAMGGLPAWCLVSVNLTKGLGASFAKNLVNGLAAISKQYKCPIVGGDITTWRGGLVLTVAIAGVTAGRRAIARNGARPDDLVAVTGTLGGSILGRHLRFQPRVKEGAWLARRFPPSAMIDVSDGLGVDAAHIAEESGVALEIDAGTIPVSAAARRLSRMDGKSPLRHAVADGEDFELLLTMPEPRLRRALEEWPFAAPLTVIGRVRRGKGAVLVRETGRRERIDAEGYQHI